MTTTSDAPLPLPSACAEIQQLYADAVVKQGACVLTFERKGEGEDYEYAVIAAEKAEAAFIAAITALTERNAELEAEVTSRRNVQNKSNDAMTATALRVNELESDNTRLSALVAEAEEALDQAEACMSIVEPRSDKAEYLRILGVVRATLSKLQAPGGEK